MKSHRFKTYQGKGDKARLQTLPANLRMSKSTLINIYGLNILEVFIGADDCEVLKKF